MTAHFSPNPGCPLESAIFFFLSTPQGLWDLSSQLEIEFVPLAVKAWSPTQWITKEDPSVHFLNQNLR